jgi:carboxylesterase type B
VPGDVSWLSVAYDASTRATMIFNDECKVVGDPARDERLAVSALPPA